MSKIGIIDVDGHNYPNLPLMKISSYHKKQGDNVEWFSPLWGGHYDKVYMSKVFSFTPDYPYFIDADEINVGGSGYCIDIENGKEVYHTERDKNLPYDIEHIYPDYSLYPQYTKDVAYGFLSRGCPRNCEFCHVANKEGKHGYKVANLEEFWRGQKNIILNDANLLACKDHINLLQQLIDSNAKIEFNQGLDIRLITDLNLEFIRKLKLKNVHFAFDKYQDKKIIVPKLKLFKEATGYGRNIVTVYILVNFDTSIEEDLERIEIVRKLNFNPYVMVYDKEHANSIYKHMQRWCNNNFIFWSGVTFSEYMARRVI